MTATTGTPTPTPTTAGRRGRPTFSAGALIIPAFVVMLVLFVLPVVRLLIDSFRGAGGGAAYKEILTSSDYRALLWRTLKLSVITTAICLIVAFPVALRVRMLKPSTRGYLNLLFLSPLLVNSVVRALGWVAILGPTSGLQNFMGDIGLGSHKLIYSDTGVVIGLVDIFLGYMIIAAETGLLGFDSRQEDAARSLGAHSMRVLTRVVFPQVLPNLIAGATVVFVLSASAYVTPTLLGGTSSQMAAPRVYELAIVQLDAQRASALVVVLIVLIAVVAYLLSRVGVSAARYRRR